MTSGGQRLNVLHVYRTYFPETQGGLQEAIRQICLGTAQHGVSNTVFALARQPIPECVDLPEARLVRERSWFELASCDFGSVSALLKFRSLAAEADVVHLHYPWPFGDVLALLAVGSCPYVITYHSDVVRQRYLNAIYSPLRSLFFRKAAAVVSTSPGYRASSPFLGSLDRSVEMIPLCFEEAFLPPRDVEREAYWVREFGQDYFLFIGVLRYYKGLDYLLRAAEISGVTVVVAGDGPEGSRLRSQWGACPNVRFVGYVNDADKHALLEGARAVVFPSHLRSEAFGMTLLEGAVRRRALISTEIGTGTSYVNEDGVTGLVVPPADPVALANAMLRLSKNPTAARAMGIAAYERYVKLFSASSVGAKYVGLYRSVLDARVRVQ
ncbi:glycosyltransferase [Niveibacterium sp. 24ML]|uniref:glycosyltransferase n=1 Tax=Niveibacterium sp. 24ML TaxID=2985512 RepID=UPI00226E4909|nr:glycosyltransferase [Niveibacterium sp. 24ML]MCX9158365.1 glycosyltransferase [Niveibacterium sp. 24ML]